MAQRIHRNTDGLKHQYAFNEWGNVVHIKKAVDYINGKKCKYFLDEKQLDEIILRSGDKNQWHFALKTDYFEFNGKKYIRDSLNESPQHYDAKLKIIGQGYFDWSDYKIFVKNCVMERRFSKSYFRADLIAELHSGEKVFIEIIKTSDTSKSKENYIITNQLPTFKIWIDNEGNFINKRFDFIGNTEIERLRENYRGKSSEYTTISFSKKSAWQEFYNEKERLDKEIEQYEKEVDFQIQRYFEGIQSRIKRRSDQAQSIVGQIRQGISDCRILRIQEQKSSNEFRSCLSNLQRETNEIIKEIKYIKNRKLEVKSTLEFFKDFKETKIVVLNNCTKIIDVEKMVELHLSFIYSNKLKPYEPYLDRLIELKKHYERKHKT